MIKNKKNRALNDIYNIPLLGFIFHNKNFIMGIRIIVLAIFLYGIYLGFVDPSKENTFTSELFWGLFWALFMVVSLATFGRIFCGICPHGFIGKYLTKFGLQKEMPSWLKNPWWGLMLIVLGWWAISYTFHGIYKTPFATALLFTILTLSAFLLFYLYKDMSYCKFICPIGSLTKAYHKISPTFLGSYKEDCSQCRTFECAKACTYNLKPFTFENKNSMQDCSLCMDCATACDAINFKIVPPAQSLYKKLKIDKIEVWVYILITASISITMSFHHGLGRSPIADQMPWVLTAQYFESFIGSSTFDSVGFFAFAYSMLVTLGLVYIGFFIASKALKTEFSKTFYTLGYAFAPLFIIGGLSHLLHSFFTHTYADIANGFVYGFSLDIAPIQDLASRKDAWLSIIGIFKYIAAFWAFLIMYKRLALFQATKTAKTIAFFSASLLIIFYLALSLSRVYISKNYTKTTDSHSNHLHIVKQKG